MANPEWTDPEDWDITVSGPVVLPGDPDISASSEECEFAFERDLQRLPVVPSVETMRLLIHPAMNFPDPGRHLWSLGKQVQRDHQGVPSKTEYETAVGLWTVIRDGIVAWKAAHEKGA